MELSKLIDSGRHVILPVKVKYLQQLILFTIEQAKQELVRELAEAKNEVYYTVDQIMAILNVSKMTL